MKGKEGDNINTILNSAEININELLLWLADYFLRSTAHVRWAVLTNFRK